MIKVENITVDDFSIAKLRRNLKNFEEQGASLGSKRRRATAKLQCVAISTSPVARCKQHSFLDWFCVESRIQFHERIPVSTARILQHSTRKCFQTATHLFASMICRTILRSLTIALRRSDIRL